MSNNNCSSQRSLLQINDRHNSPTDLSRALSRVAFFHDGITISKIDLRFNIMGAERRARAIATAPRRNRYDDEEEDNEQKKTFFGFIKTPAVLIPIQSVTQQTQSLPQTQSNISHFHVDPPVHGEFDYLYSHNSCRNRYLSAPLP